MNVEINGTTLRYLIEKKRDEMIQLANFYVLTSPEVILVSQELDKLLNMLAKGDSNLKEYIA
ncbi:aspartyl-phosphate phosphatase Spo0E family protein [Bacillus paramycoides]|uniref:aspartyl-phosphate phosphatase Spo0E family protein n=1 Tax=Bacillus paramycoides TaxID=2026194 RepID=UPI002E24A4A0|nr:aspartyl-phosphate phosphatase Spo0E family protein [Bacillus paramycoides]